MATLLGGPLDGEVRPLEYGEVFVPIKSTAFYGRPGDEMRLPLVETPPRHRYVARQDDDGRWWYVFERATA